MVTVLWFGAKVVLSFVLFAVIMFWVTESPEF